MYYVIKDKKDICGVNVINKEPEKYIIKGSKEECNKYHQQLYKEYVDSQQSNLV